MDHPWYATWFNTPYYHDLYQHRDLTEARQFIRELCGQLGVRPGERALDMACGRGRHAQVLAELGLRTTGIDLSTESIEFAKQFESELLQFQVGDMLQPIEHEPVKWVFNIFTSFGYFENDDLHQEAIRHMAQALEPGGKLVFDYMNGAKITDQLVPEDTVQTDLCTYHIKRQLDGDTIVKTIRFTVDCSVNVYEERVRAFTVEELRAFMEQAGLRVLHTKGDYDMSPYHAAFSDRIIMVSEKPL